MTSRVAAEDLTIDGVTVPQGTMVVALLGAANRDPAVFPDPDVLDVGRQPNPHLGFGFGPHFCLGAPLARLEVAIALRHFLDRFPAMALADEPLDWHPTVLSRALVRLPVRLEAAESRRDV
jgi:cytochrome P450